MSEIKKSVVKNVQSTGTWETKREPIKTFYKFEITMENGDTGEYSSVKLEQDKFVVGQEVEYNYIGGDFPKIKPYYPNPNAGSYHYNKPTENEEEKEERIARSVAIKLAFEHAPTFGLSSLKDMEAIANSISGYILTGNMPFPKTDPRPPVTPADVEKQIEKDPF